MHLREELEQRGLLKQYSNEAFFDLYNKWWQILYIGMDPSADSLTIGNFAMFMTALQFMKRWNKLIFIVWWETGIIWDPGGRDTERQLQTIEQFNKNFDTIDKQVRFLLKNIEEVSWIKCEYIIKNNHDFYRNMTFTDFLRNIGKHITVNNMIKKETVAKRIEDPDKSISYTEFSYMLIQWYDFVRLYEDFNCKLQICGSDQRGNGVTWLELISKILGKDDAYIMTSPLILDSQWNKFGKSAGNAVWLSPVKNSPFFVYQYFLNTADQDVSRFLKVYSLYTLEEIDKIQIEHDSKPELRYGQRKLAHAVCQIIFGTISADLAQDITDFLFSEDKLEKLKNMNKELKNSIANEVGSIVLSSDSINIIDWLIDSGLSESRWEAKKLIEQWWVSIDGLSVRDLTMTITNQNYFIQKGKKAIRIIL